MSKTIHTHPDNVHLVEKLFEKEFKAEVEATKDHIHYMNLRWPSIEIKTNHHMEKERGSGKYRVKQSRFTTYCDGVGKPASWVIYCGFAEEIMEPNFYAVDDRLVVWNPFKWDFGVNSLYTPKFMITNAMA